MIFYVLRYLILKKLVVVYKPRLLCNWNRKSLIIHHEIKDMFIDKLKLGYKVFIIKFHTSMCELQFTSVHFIL